MFTCCLELGPRDCHLVFVALVVGFSVRGGIFPMSPCITTLPATCPGRGAMPEVSTTAMQAGAGEGEENSVEGRFLSEEVTICDKDTRYQ